MGEAMTCLRLAALVTSIVTWVLPCAAMADSAQEEIDYLLDTVGHSGCTFVRNGTEHSASEAEAHLRLKYRKGAKYAKTADDFIARLATQSSWTRQAYVIACPDVPREPSGAWLSKRLADYRARPEP